MTARIYRYVIDSRDRNTNIYPSPASYSINLPESILNVESVKLLLADVPFSRYIVHNANNILHISETGNATNAIAIELITGDYEAVALANHIQSRLNAKCNAMYTVTYDNIRDTFTISSDLTDKVTEGIFYSSCMIACKGDPIIVDDKPSNAFKPRSICRVIGFGNGDYDGNVSDGINKYTSTGVRTGVLTIIDAITPVVLIGDMLMLTCIGINGSFPAFVTATTSTTANVIIPSSFTGNIPASSGSITVTNAINGRIVAPFRKNFARDKYIVLRVTNVESIYGITNIIDRSFGIINSKDCALNNEYKHDSYKHFDPPLNSLKKLQISFYDYNGNLYDFQNQEHRLELDFAVWGQRQIKTLCNM
jgi:hypothetical protein